MTRVIAVQGAASIREVPGLSALAEDARWYFARNEIQLREALGEAEILLGWDFRAGILREVWPGARRLKWIHWGGAGVDALLFPELVESEVVVTNARGVFDRPMAEYVLGLIIAFTKRFAETWSLQSRRQWRHRLTDTLQGKSVLIVGAGSIGRETARLCAAAGMCVSGVGRRARTGDPDFGRVHACKSLHRALPDADFVVIAAPLTPETRRLFTAEHFRRMKRSARLLNVGRGAIVDQADLVRALDTGEIAGAALDVFEEEPLPATSPLWSLPNVVVSPHMSGDFNGYEHALAEIFIENYRRYREGEPLLNLVDKRLGFVPCTSDP